MQRECKCGGRGEEGECVVCKMGRGEISEEGRKRLKELEAVMGERE